MATLIPQDLDFADTAPVIAEHVGVIDGTSQEVWDAILDYERWPEWFDALRSCTATSDPATGVGSTRTVTLAGGTAIEERFIAWEEPALWAFTVTSAPPLVASLVERITIRSIGPRLTEVTYRMALGPKKGTTLLVKAARPQLAKNLKVALRKLNGEVARRRPASAEPMAEPTLVPDHDHDHDHD